MGFYSGLNAEQYDRTYSDVELVKRIASYFKPHWRRLIVISLSIIVISSMGAFLPVVVSRGVDLISESERSELYFAIPLIVLVFGVLMWLANLIRRRFTVRTIAGAVTALASDAFEASTEHDLSFYDEYSTGKIVSRITGDTNDFGQLVTLTMDLISQLLETVILTFVLLRIDTTLTLYLFGMVPVILLVAVSFRKIARKVTRAGMRAIASVNATIKESIGGIAVAKNYRQEKNVYREFYAANWLSYSVNFKRGVIMTLIHPMLNAIGAIGTAVLVYFGGLSVEQGIVTAGAWYLFIMSMDRFMYPVMSLSSYWTQVQNGLSAAERVFALIDAEATVVQTGSIKPDRLRGEIDFKHVNFHYKTGEMVLNDFSLNIKPGENLAFVGHTGAGKSSIAKLIARFYEFQDGEILIDGQDIRSFDLHSYRKQLGIVSQVPFLFSGTVLENICYTCDKANRDEVLRLGKQIGDGEWLSTLSDGLDTQVGERGTLLSMGQRQLVSLMRVLVQNPAIFILDEATASIDPFTEWQIQQALNLILKNTTSILIAHRLSTIKSADRIIVIDSGRILEEGNHQQLMQAGGHYAELYNTYFRHQSLEYVEQTRKQEILRSVAFGGSTS